MTREPTLTAASRAASASLRATRYAFALAIVLCAAVGVYLTIIDRTSSLAVKLSGLGINLIAAAAFSTIFALLVDRENRNLLDQRLDDRLGAQTSSILEAVSNLNSAYLPTGVHPPVQTFDPEFNETLMSDLNHSSYYYFRGPSAKYIPARLRALRRRPDSVRIYVPGPESSASIRFDIANRSRTGPVAESDAQTLYRQFTEDLLSALVGLFDCRVYGRIEVFFCEDTLVSRHEVTEQHLYTSWYTSVQNTSGIKFPETTIFPRSSVHYQTMMIDMDRRSSLATQSLLIGPELDGADFLSHLERIFGRPYDVDEIGHIAKTYWESRAGFLAFLKEL
jgi:hypothetical protein